MEEVEDWRARLEREENEREARAAAWQAQRLQFRSKLFGSQDKFDWLAPPPVEDLDAMLGEHAAQLRNAARCITESALQDDTAKNTVAAVTTLTRVVQANLAIAKVLAKSKTVRGVTESKDAQD